MTNYERYEVECGKGWRKLLEPIFNYIEDYNKDKEGEERIEILQVKEKFGGLRFYTNFYTSELHDLIEKAEQEAYETCEICGTKENVGMTVRGWLTTCCMECVKTRAAKNTDRDYYWKNYKTSKLFRVFEDGTVEQVD